MTYTCYTTREYPVQVDHLPSCGVIIMITIRPIVAIDSKDKSNQRWRRLISLKSDYNLGLAWIGWMVFLSRPREAIIPVNLPPQVLKTIIRIKRMKIRMTIVIVLPTHCIFVSSAPFLLIASPDRGHKKGLKSAIDPSFPTAARAPLNPPIWR